MSNFQDRILAWVQKWVKEYDIECNDLNKDFTDGRLFCAIIHKFVPDAFDFNSLSNDPEKNLRLAFDTAYEKLGIEKLLDIEDITDFEVPDTLIVATYLSEIYQYYTDWKKENKGEDEEEEEEEENVNFDSSKFETEREYYRQFYQDNRVNRRESRKISSPVPFDWNNVDSHRRMKSEISSPKEVDEDEIEENSVNGYVEEKKESSDESEVSKENPGTESPAFEGRGVVDERADESGFHFKMRNFKYSRTIHPTEDFFEKIGWKKTVGPQGRFVIFHNYSAFPRLIKYFLWCLMIETTMLALFTLTCWILGLLAFQNWGWVLIFVHLLLCIIAYPVYFIVCWILFYDETTIVFDSEDPTVEIQNTKHLFIKTRHRIRRGDFEKIKIIQHTDLRKWIFVWLTFMLWFFSMGVHIHILIFTILSFIFYAIGRKRRLIAEVSEEEYIIICEWDENWGSNNKYLGKRAKREIGSIFNL